MSEPRLRVLSLGAGVQSTTLALMAAHGEIMPMPDCAVFADTQSEPAAVYEHLRWLASPGVLPFPVHVETRGNLGDQILKATQGRSLRGSHARPPFFVLNPDGTTGQLRRQCTRDYKIDVIEHKVRDLLGLRKRQRWPAHPVVEQWIGISRDEAHRAKPSGRAAIQRRYPLLDLGMRRWDCLQWLKRHGYPEPSKSACTFCPFHDDAQWRLLRDQDAVGWERAVELDAAIRFGLRSDSLVGELFLHRSLRPLGEVDLSTAAERGQPDLFGNECEGMCGV